MGNFVDLLRSLVPRPRVFDPSVIGDPLAQQIEWTPLRRGGTNFRTHALAARGPDRMVFRPAAAALLFNGIFLVSGVGLLVAFVILLFTQRFEAGSLVLLGLGAVFTAVGTGLFVSGTTPIVFDAKSGLFWRGRTAPTEVFNRRAVKVMTEITQIHALQLLSECCRGNKSSYYSYELNLVLHDGRRLPVVDHGNARRLREDAATLAQFLKVPVWDAI